MAITRNHIIVAAAILLLALGYFVVTPAIQLRNFKASETKHNIINDQITLVYDNFKNGNDNRQTVQDAKSALDTNRDTITKFHSLPALSCNKRYKEASAIDKNEEAYVAKAQSFLDYYTSLLDLKTQSDSVGLLDQAKNAATRLALDSKIQLEIVELRLLNAKITKGHAQL